MFRHAFGHFDRRYQAGGSGPAGSGQIVCGAVIDGGPNDGQSERNNFV